MLASVCQPEPLRLQAIRRNFVFYVALPIKGRRNVSQDKAWQDYEAAAQFLLGQMALHFGLGSVEGKQVVPGLGTNWQIDAKGVREDGEGFVIIECKRFVKHCVSQAIIGTLACSIRDTGAIGGIIVSPLPLQSGAKKLAAHNNILEISLDEHSTNSDYILRFINKLFVGVSERAVIGESVDVTIIRSSDKV